MIYFGKYISANACMIGIISFYPFHIATSSSSAGRMLSDSIRCALILSRISINIWSCRSSR